MYENETGTAITLTRPPLPEWLTEAEADAANAPKAPAPLRITLPTGAKDGATITVDVTAGSWGGALGGADGIPVTVCAAAHVRTVAGGVTVRGAAHDLGGSLYFTRDGDLHRVSDYVRRIQPAGRSRWAPYLPATKAGIAQLAPATDALADELTRTGWGAAMRTGQRYDEYRKALADYRDGLTRGCGCVEGRKALGQPYETETVERMGGTWPMLPEAPLHWGCDCGGSEYRERRAFEALRAAVALAPYRLPVGDVRAVALALADDFTGTPAELLATAAAVAEASAADAGTGQSDDQGDELAPVRVSVDGWADFLAETEPAADDVATAAGPLAWARQDRLPFELATTSRELAEPVDACESCGGFLDDAGAERCGECVAERAAAGAAA